MQCASRTKEGKNSKISLSHSMLFSIGFNVECVTNVPKCCNGIGIRGTKKRNQKRASLSHSCDRIFRLHNYYYGTKDTTHAAHSAQCTHVLTRCSFKQASAILSEKLHLLRSSFSSYPSFFVRERTVAPKIYESHRHFLCSLRPPVNVTHKTTQTIIIIIIMWCLVMPCACIGNNKRSRGDKIVVF